MINFGRLLRESWRITWTCWPLWLLALLLFITVIPTGILAGGFGAAAALLAMPFPGRPPFWLRQMQAVPGPAWVVIAALALLVLVVTTAMTWMLQAASIRGAALAAEHGTVSLREAARLGRGRAVSIVQLSVTFGFLVGALGLLPPLALILLRRFQFGLELFNLAQSLLVPLNMALGLMLLLVMMSIALEDLRPRAAFGRAWRVFRSGWWGFLFVVGLSFIVSLIAVLPILPLAVVLPMAMFSPLLGTVLTIACCGVAGPIAMAAMLFVAVFTLVLYTLTYREAARLAGAGAASDSPPS